MIARTIGTKRSRIDHYGTEDPVPETFETVGREWIGERLLQGAPVETPRTGPDPRPGDGKLGPAPEMKEGWSGIPEKTGKDLTGPEFPSLRILAPWYKEPPSMRIIGIIEKPVPQEGIGSVHPLCQSPQARMKVRGMVERMALAEDRDVRKGVVPLQDVGQIGMGLAAEIRKGAPQDPLP